MLHVRVTGGYTGKAKSCVEAWVPTVSINRPLSFYDFFLKQKKNYYNQLYIGVKKGGTVQGERGREEERGNPKGEGDQRKGGQRWDVRHLHG